MWILFGRFHLSHSSRSVLASKTPFIVELSYLKAVDMYVCEGLHILGHKTGVYK